MKVFNFIFLLFLAPFTKSCEMTRNSNDNGKYEMKNLMGTWISYDDTLWSIHFEKDYGYNLYEGKIDSFKCYIKPDCDSITTKKENNILIMESLEDKTKICYEILNLTKKEVSFMTDQGKIFSFRKKPEKME